MLNILKSKTILFSLALAVLSVIQGYTGLLPVSQHAQMIIGLIISVCVAVLRVLTTMPLTQK